MEERTEYRERALAERAIGFYETWEEDTPRPVYHACTPGSVHASRIATTLCTHRLVHASRIARFADQLLHLLRLEPLGEAASFPWKQPSRLFVLLQIHGRAPQDIGALHRPIDEARRIFGRITSYTIHLKGSR